MVADHLSVMEADSAICAGRLVKRGEEKEKGSHDAGDQRCSGSSVPGSRLLANGCEHLVPSARPGVSALTLAPKDPLGCRLTHRS